MQKENPNLLFKAAGKLKTVRRSGWIKKAGVEDAESVADHCFRMAIIGAYFGELTSLDSGKIVRMCLIHDLAESKIGDLLPEEKESEKSHRKIEDTAMRRIMNDLPGRIKARFLGDWSELLENKSKEARLVWKIDKLEMGLQMKDYVASGASRKALLELDPTKLLTQQMKKILREYC